jgi:dihydrofolate synthase / folylpolyglutamate synthase
MRFGLDRMRRMMTALGSPERSFRSIHVLGTNGKSSTTRMIAAILERHGVRTGTYTSPHLVSYSERVQIGECDIDPGAFAGAVARAAAAAERVNRTLGEDDHVTQFELLTAAAFWELTRQGVEVAVIEAGLGGRYDATSVIESDVTVLTNVGLEHTRWLGPTIADIAAEKLAVVTPGTPLVLGAAMHEDALAVAHSVAERQQARIVRAGAPWSASLLTGSGFQRANFALAKVTAETYLEKVGIEPSAEAVHEAALQTRAPGRIHVIDGEPLTVLDGAHNPDAARALVETLPELMQGRSVGLVLGVLEDKDAASMLHALLPLCERAWFTAPPSARALSPAALQSLARQQDFEGVVCEPHPRRALALAREWARDRAQQGRAVLATGSIYLVGNLLAEFCEAGSLRGESVRTKRGEGVSERRREVGS